MKIEKKLFIVIQVLAVLIGVVAFVDEYQRHAYGHMFGSILLITTAGWSLYAYSNFPSEKDEHEY